MKNINPLDRIRELCEEREWSYYQLSKASGIPYSTLNTMMNNKNMPSLPTLQKLCSGFGISITEFFNPAENYQNLTAEQSACLSLFTSMSQEDRRLVLAYMKGIAKKL